MLTVLVHEIGHVLGFGHDAAPEVMAESLAAGQRVLLTADAGLAVQAAGLLSAPLVQSPVGTLTAQTADTGPITFRIFNHNGNGIPDVQVTGASSGNATYDDIASIIGAQTGLGDKIVIDINSDTTWQVTGSNAGIVTIAGYTAVSFSRVKNLTGGAGNDTFEFSGGTIDGVIETGADGGFLWEADGSGDVLRWEINDAYGVAGGNPGWDYLFIDGLLTFQANASAVISIDLRSLTRPVVPGPRPFADRALNETPGHVFNFDFREEFLWPIVYAADGIDENFDANWFSIDAGDFANELGGGSFAVEKLLDNQTLALHFRPGPVTSDPAEYFGKTGDVLVIDLKPLAPSQTTFVPIATPVHPNASVIFADDFETSGLLYLAPRISYLSGSTLTDIEDNALMRARGFFGTLVAGPAVVPQYLELHGSGHYPCGAGLQLLRAFRVGRARR